MESPTPKLKSPQEQVKFYITSFFALLAIFDFSVFVMLVPFVVDPSWATIKAEFVKEPVSCTVDRVEHVVGRSECKWSSCWEGCTEQKAECTHIYVKYNRIPFFSTENSTNEGGGGGGEASESSVTESVTPEPANETEGKLFVNVKGCGYPPSVNCSVFEKNNSKTGEPFPCFYSLVKPDLVVKEYDTKVARSRIIYCLAIPIPVFFVSISVLTAMHVAGLRNRLLPYIWPLLRPFFEKIYRLFPQSNGYAMPVAQEEFDTEDYDTSAGGGSMDYFGLPDESRSFVRPLRRPSLCKKIDMTDLNGADAFICDSPTTSRRAHL